MCVISASAGSSEQCRTVSLNVQRQIERVETALAGSTADQEIRSELASLKKVLEYHQHCQSEPVQLPEAGVTQVRPSSPADRPSPADLYRELDRSHQSVATPRKAQELDGSAQAAIRQIDAQLAAARMDKLFIRSLLSGLRIGHH